MPDRSKDISIRQADLLRTLNSGSATISREKPYRLIEGDRGTPIDARTVAVLIDKGYLEVRSDGSVAVTKKGAEYTGTGMY